MTIETEIAALTAAATDLTDTVNTTISYLASDQIGKGQDMIGEPTVQQLFASTGGSRGTGSIYHAGGNRYVEVASGSSDYDIITEGGIKLNISPLDDNAVISVLAFHQGGTNIRAACLSAIKAVKNGRIKSRSILIPWVSGGWTVDQQTLFDASDCTITIAGDIRLTATTAQHTLVFAPNADVTPTISAKNIRVIGLGVTIDGNASAMTFPEPVPGTVDTFSAVRFNAVENLYATGLHATNGPMDSMSCKRCPRHLIEHCTMSLSRWDNAFSATTDLADYNQDNPLTWGGGIVRKCTAISAHDVGFTAFNCSGQWFDQCTSYTCDAGFSYEDSYGTPDIKRYFGGFRNCSSHSAKTSGFYIDADEITVDDDCLSRNTRGTTWDNSANLYENGVLVSSVRRAYIGGRHEGNGRCGIAAFNANGIDMQIEISARCTGNDWHGVYLREQSRIKILPSSRFDGNGALSAVFGGTYGHGIYATSTTPAMTGTGIVEIDGCEISKNASRAILIHGYKRAIVRGVWGEDNFQNAAAGSAVGIQFETMNSAIAENCELNDTTGRQTFVINFTSDVVNGRDVGTRGNYATGMVANASTTTRYSTKPTTLTASQSWVIPTITAGNRASLNLTVLGADVGDYVNVSFSGDIGLRTAYASVLSSGTVTVWLANYTAASITGETLTVRTQTTPRNAR